MDLEGHIGLLQATFPKDFESYPVVGQTEESLQAFMEGTNLELPPEILAFFEIANGLPVGSRGLDGISPTHRYRKRPKYRYPDVESVYSYLPKLHDAGWLPIGTDGCGSYYTIPLKGDFGRVSRSFFTTMNTTTTLPTSWLRTWNTSSSFSSRMK